MAHRGNKQSKGDSIFEGTRRDGDNESSGIALGFITLDHRNIGEILSDWQQQTAPGNPELFIRDTLGLQDSISREDFIRLLSGDAVPSRELVLLTSAMVPPEISTLRVMRHRGEQAIRTAGERPVISVPSTVIVRSKLARLEQIRQGGYAGASPAFEAFRDGLLARLSGPDSPLDPRKTMANLARHLMIAPAVLEGRQSLAPERARQVGEELASMLRLQEDKFDAFADGAAEALGEQKAAPGTRLAQAARFLRNCVGLTQVDLQSKISRRILSAIELGYVPNDDGVTALARALHLSGEELGQLATITAVARSEQGGHDNIKGVVHYFEKEWLTTESYLQAALKQPSLFSQKPETISGNIEGVVGRFKEHGVTTDAYLRAALKQPSLFTFKPETISINIEGVVERFKEQGLTTKAYLQAALKHPQLFSQKPETISGNIEGVVGRFKEHGLTTDAYLRAALKQPSLFTFKPDTIIGHMNIVCGLYDDGVFTVSTPRHDVPISEEVSHPHAPVIDFLMRNPALICLDENNLHLRGIHQALTGTKPNPRNLLRSRKQTEEGLLRHLGHDDPVKPIGGSRDPSWQDHPTEEEAKKWVLRALARNYFKSIKPER